MPWKGDEGRGDWWGDWYWKQTCDSICDIPYKKYLALWTCKVNFRGTHTSPVAAGRCLRRPWHTSPHSGEGKRRANEVCPYILHIRHTMTNRFYIQGDTPSFTLRGTLPKRNNLSLFAELPHSSHAVNSPCPWQVPQFCLRSEYFLYKWKFL